MNLYEEIAKTKTGWADCTAFKKAVEYYFPPPEYRFVTGDIIDSWGGEYYLAPSVWRGKKKVYQFEEICPYSHRSYKEAFDKLLGHIHIRVSQRAKRRKENVA